jgi:hypothetical protein
MDSVQSHSTFENQLTPSQQQQSYNQRHFQSLNQLTDQKFVHLQYETRGGRGSLPKNQKVIRNPENGQFMQNRSKGPSGVTTSRNADKSVPNQKSNPRIKPYTSI